MARSFSGAKALTALVIDGFSTVITRRGFSAAAPQGVVSSVARAGATAGSRSVKKKSGEKIVGNTEKVSWVPDPVTGYYRPENGAQEIDVAELRATLLKKH
ncbi:Indole-3-acetic acid-induced protein ARG2 [Morus notabilis]|uniref:Indole-3-acetic acid-induced protein ARG2 n=1 Tax=Morus notabilis TaxID=981085 RepID=W9QFH4_9ROSA|nr:indole-3-acetic acid-induced protein ARG2 [Morus notabilis]EXB33514.1 Indole-3-acetic acid-induced protein ARG2 [Morus notabilis]